MSSNAKRLSNQRYYWNNRDKRKEYFKLYFRKLKLEILHQISNDIKCNYCGDTNLDNLSIDHIDENGSIHRKQILGKEKWKGKYDGIRFYRLLKKENFKSMKDYNLQILCKSCNTAKSNHIQGR
jgi:5-methylcytosine-specific restriction endonuclease McrA